MKKTIAISDNVRLLTKRSKFGYVYSEALVEIDDFRGEFPIFENLPTLNAQLLDIVSAFKDINVSLSVKLIYAEPDKVSLLVNGSLILNFSLLYKASVSPSMALRLCGMKKRDVSVALKSSGEKLTPIYETVRFSNGGVRIDAKTKDGRRVTVKVTRNKRK